MGMLRRAVERLHRSQRRLSPDPAVESLIEQAAENLDYLRSLKEATGDFKNLCDLTAEDLLSNAIRRSEEGKYDDAVARLYRCLEMIGQIEFQKQFGCGTSRVDPEVLPQSIRAEYCHKHGFKDDKDGKEYLRLGLDAAFNALAEAGNEIGRNYKKNYERIRSVLQTRNQSILAHGQQPVEEKTFEKMRKIVEELFGVQAKVRFPKIEWK
jgi:CRISPR-associated protein (TIGR02710 family)